MSTPKSLLVLAATLIVLFHANSQGVGIGVESPNPNAVLELVSPTNNQGLLVPKLTTAQRTASSFTNNLTQNENGLLVYDTDENAFYFWINSQWVSMQTAVNVTAGNGIQIVDGEISNTGDLDSSNELQDISITGSQLSISNGSTVDFSILDTNTQLTEAEVDAFVANNGYLDTESDPSVPSNLKDGVDWNEIASIPSDLADGDDDTQLTEVEVDAFTENNGYLTSEVDGSITNEIQDLELDGSTLRITNNASATDIDLTPFTGTNTDEQTLSLSGSDLSISGGNTIDIGSIDTDTQLSDADIAALGYVKTDNDTDDQTLSFDGTILSIADGNSVDISSLSDGTGTDDQVASEVDVSPSGNLGSDNVQSALEELQSEINTLTAGGSDGNDFVSSGSLSGTDLTLNIPNQTNPVIDLSDLQDGTGTDNQTISFDGTNISIEGGNSVNISAIDTDIDTDDQTLSFDGTNLSIADGNSIDISSLSDGTGTDDQNASEVVVTPSGNLGSNDVQSALEELQTDINTLAAGGSDGNDFVSSGSLSGTDLTLSIPNQTNPVIDLSGLQDGFEANTDNQDLSLSGTTLSLTGDATSVDLSTIQDGTGTDNQTISFDGTNISIEGGNSVNISAIDTDTDTDDQTLSFDGTNLSIADGNSVDISSLSDGTGTDDQVASEVDVSPSGNLGSDNVQSDLEELQSDINTLAAGGSDGNDFVSSGSLSGTDLTLNIPFFPFLFWKCC